MMWPKTLPVFPIWNNDDLCDRCFHWWNQSDLSQEQDHCRPMYDTNDLYRALSPDQHRLLKQIVDAGIMCPVFEKLNTANLDQALTGWDPQMQPLIRELARHALPNRSEERAEEELVASPVDRTIVLVNADLLKWLGEDPERVYSLSPSAFEDVVAQLFETQGYSVVQTPRTKDGGKDLYAYKKDDVVESLYVVECKRYLPPRKVGVEVARSLYGVMRQERVTGGVIVATTYFTRDALAFTQGLGYQLFLRDYGDLSRWLEAGCSISGLRHNSYEAPSRQGVDAP